jgi:hypothetical protein
MNKKITFTSLILVLLTLFISGCLDFFTSDVSSIIYESHPTGVRYTISYGYSVNCSGKGKYTLLYDCDLPEALEGIVYTPSALNNDYEQKTLATFNIVYSWNISSTINKKYTLGLTTNIDAESYMVSDLNGVNALTIKEIFNQHPKLVDQYTMAQSNDSITFIDPEDDAIQTISTGVINTIGTNNAFLVAKELFKWLKQQTTYQTHTDSNNNVQSASFTLQCRTGDCDDLSFLYISLCRGAGIPARFIKGFLIEEDIGTPHAWVEVFVGPGIGKDGWIPVECAGVSGNIELEVHQNFGIEQANYLRTFMDDGSDESMNISLTGFFSIFEKNRVIEAEAFVEVHNFQVVKSNQLEVDDSGNRFYK